MTELLPFTTEKYALLQQLLRNMGTVVIGFSGGVDSTLLLRVALDTLGKENVHAVIGVSESYPAREQAEARELAEGMGAFFSVVNSEEMKDARYVENSKDRCYYCKSDLFGRLMKFAEENKYAFVLDGNNADDAGDYRPGRKAALELGVRSPLMDVGMTKDEIREISKMLGLPTWVKPSYACLASRIPYGTSITSGALSAIEAGEEFLRGEGFTQLRVRHHGDVARIELLPEELGRMLDAELRERTTAKLRALGYKYVTLDLLGYRTGSMNEVLKNGGK